jgi:uncharacterized protein (DUF1499 family)
MTVIFERRSSASAIWARRLALFSAVLLVTSTAGHRFALIGTVPFFWLLGIVAGLALVSLLLAGIGFFRLWEYGDRGGRASTRAVLIALLVLLPFALGGFRLFTLPRLTDISTDTMDPPVFRLAAANRAAGMNPIGGISREDASQQDAYYPSATGRRYPLAVDRAHDIVLAVLRNLGWRVTRNPRMEIEAGEITIEAEARSPIFGFVSDVAVRIVDEGDSSYIDVRSVSRYGLHDLGDNAAKIDRFFAAVEAEILARNAPVVQQLE